MANEGKKRPDDLTYSRKLPTSEEVSRAAFDAKRTAELVSKYRLTAVEIAQLLDRLPVKPVPW